MGAFVAVIAAATLTLDISIRHTWENAVRNDIEKLLVQNAQGFALRVENDHQHSLQQMANEEARITQTRVTIIARDGVVFADSEADARTMENHAGRPEVEAALAGKTGTSPRVSTFQFAAADVFNSCQSSARHRACFAPCARAGSGDRRSHLAPPAPH